MHKQMNMCFVYLILNATSLFLLVQDFGLVHISDRAGVNLVCSCILTVIDGQVLCTCPPLSRRDSYAVFDKAFHLKGKICLKSTEVVSIRSKHTSILWATDKGWQELTNGITPTLHCTKDEDGITKTHKEILA